MQLLPNTLYAKSHQSLVKKSFPPGLSLFRCIFKVMIHFLKHVQGGEFEDIITRCAFRRM